MSLDEERRYFDDYSEEYQNFLIKAEWNKDPQYFKTVHMSALACFKILTHANGGKTSSVMGMLIGRVVPHAIIINDSFALPHEGDEDYVNEHQDSDHNTHNAAYDFLSKKLGNEGDFMGWYHSHPNFNVWLSKKDITSQIEFQLGSGNNLGVAVVVDHLKTITSRYVEIGAFRTFPSDYSPDPTYQAVPLDVGEANRSDYEDNYRKYYKLDFKVFRSPTDEILFKMFRAHLWVNTLSYSPLAENHQYYGNKTKQLHAMAKEQGAGKGRGGSGGGGASVAAGAGAGSGASSSSSSNADDKKSGGGKDGKDGIRAATSAVVGDYLMALTTEITKHGVFSE